MHQIFQICRNIKEHITDSTGKISSLFMEVNNKLKTEGLSEQGLKQFDKLFKTWIKTNGSLSEDG